VLYRKALELAPSTRTRMSLALALLHRGADEEAKGVLEQGLAQEPQHQPMANALARVLAASSSAKVRDARKALQLAETLLQKTASAEVGQTYAMALAASGQFDRAVQVQEQVAAAFTADSSAPRRAFVQANLARYRERRGALQPWAREDPIFQPRSPIVTRTQG
jgi:tetratricopeptide (TPR) repeat protein